MPAEAGGVVLAAYGLGKHYAGVTALRGADITLRAGEIHALVGENGAGKSTLVKLLSGVERPDAGRIELDGEPVASAGRAVAVVAQELSLFPDLTVAENLFPDRPPTRGGLTSRRAVAARAGPLLDQLGLRVPMHARVETLPIADRQLLEVCRAALAGARVLLLDEPTSSLPKASVARLEKVIRSLAARGITVLYISHFLEEVLAMADRVTVLRDGAVVRAGVPSASVRLPDLVAAMLGAPPEASGPRPPAAATPGEPAVTFTDVAVPGMLSGVSFTAAGGEIVGMAGLAGAGHLAALEVVCGQKTATAGSVRVLGRPGPRSLRAAIRAGVGVVSSDRKRFGLMAADPVWHNVAAVRWLGLGRGRGWLDVPDLVARADRQLTRLHVRGDVRGPVAGLSGGNQQKVVLAKWLEVAPKVLVLDDPTRGVDVGARAELHRVLGEVAAAGTAVLLASTDLHELAAVCHRVLVFQRGRIVDELAGEQLTEARLSLAMNAGFVRAP